MADDDAEAAAFLSEYREAVARDLRAAVQLVNGGLVEAVDAGLEVFVRVEPVGGKPRIHLSMSKPV